MIVHVEKRNILAWLAIKSQYSDDGFCHRTSDTVDPQNGDKSEGILQLRKSVTWEDI